MKGTGPATKYSVGKLLLELEKIKVVELSRGETLLSEVSKKNREILDLLNLCA